MNGQNIVNCSKIKPLILEKVIVKAKKSKDRDALNESSSEIYNEEDQKIDEQSGSNEDINFPNKDEYIV